MFDSSTLLTFLALVLTGEPPEDATRDFSLPAGAVIERIARDAVAHDIYTLTVNGRGEPIVAGRGYISTLVDDDGDGSFDRAVEFLTEKKSSGAMGLLCEGTRLYVVADDGLWRYLDENNDRRADSPGTRICELRTRGEHEAHGVVRGPDGDLYVMCGNMTGIDQKFPIGPSPIVAPIAGCVIRLSEDGSKRAIIADGFRNAYDLAFAPDGRLFTYDSDNERCVSLPWYEPTRFYEVIPAGHHGWRTPQQGTYWRFPPYFADAVPPAASIARGSPTGVVATHRAQFPPAYKDGFLLFDWTFGKIFFARPSPESGRPASVVSFLETKGTGGFAPTGGAIDPTTGTLLVAVGGRGTAGGVYRIRFPAVSSADQQPPASSFVASAPAQLHRGTWLITVTGPKQSVDDAAWNRAFDQLAWHLESLTLTEREQVARSGLSRGGRVRRFGVVRLLRTLPTARRIDVVKETTDVGERITLAWSLIDDNLVAAVDILEPIARTATEQAVRLDAIRLLQRCVGDEVRREDFDTIREGYAVRRRNSLTEPLADRLTKLADSLFPTGDRNVDRELSRLTAFLTAADASLARKVVAALSPEHPPADDIHYLIVRGCLPVPLDSEATDRVSGSLLTLDNRREARGEKKDRNWPVRLREIVATLSQRTPRLIDQMVTDARFGAPDHLLFTEVKGIDRRAVAQTFWKRLTADADYPVTPPLVRLVAEGDDPAIHAWVRKQAADPVLAADAIAVLAKKPVGDDGPVLRHALDSFDPATVRRAADALRKLSDAPVTEDDWRALAGLTRRVELDPLLKPVTDAVDALWRHWSREPKPPAGGWTAWLQEHHPSAAASRSTTAVPQAELIGRADAIDWKAGDATRGAKLFETLGCRGCHAGGSSLGPDLAGVTKRFSRRDLMTAIVDPSHDIAGRYQATLIVSNEGDVSIGLVIYEAADGLILQSAGDQIRRFSAENIATKQISRRSLMPEGLLRDRTDGEVADLAAYLDTLSR